MVTVLLACRYWISPSGLPLLQVVKADGTVSVIVFPSIETNTPSSPTVLPKFIQDGRLIVVNDGQIKKHPLPAMVKLGKLTVSTNPQVLKQPTPAVIS